MNQTWTRVLPQFIQTYLDSRPNLQRIICNIGWLTADRVLRLGVGLFVVVWIARYLGPEQYGLYSYAISIVAVLGPIATLSLDSIVVRDLVRDPDSQAEILGTAFALRLIGSSLTVLTALGVVAMLRPGDGLSLCLVGIVAIGTVFQAFDTIDLWFQSRVQSKYTVYTRDSAFVLLAVVKVLLILAHASLMAFAVASLAEIVVGALGLAFFYQRRVSALVNWRASYRLVRKWLVEGWPLLLSGVAIMIFTRIDQVLLGTIIGNKELGIYAAAVRLTEVWNFVPLIVSTSIYPSLVQLYHTSEELFYDRLQLVMGYFFWGNLLLAIVTTIFSRRVIILLYGIDYARSAGVLSILIYSSIFVSMGVIFSAKFVLAGTTRVALYATTICALSNLVLNLLLIPSYGAYGAAVSTVLSYPLPLIPITVFFDRRMGLTYRASVFHMFKRRG